MSVSLLIRLETAQYPQAYQLEIRIESLTHGITTTTIRKYLKLCDGHFYGVILSRVMVAGSGGPWFESWPADRLFLVIFLSLQSNAAIIHQIRSDCFLPRNFNPSLTYHLAEFLINLL
jgi:hypothetical protein